jgi:nitrous oxidase accessory protein NosD
MNRKSKAARARRRIAAMLGSGAMALAFGVTMTANVAAAATCAVGGSESYTTIQSAVNDLSCNPIIVDPGTYPENVTISRSLTLKGAQHGLDARTRSGASESTISGNPAILINSSASDVVVDGFTITATNTDGSADGVTVSAGASGAVITNNIFDGITSIIDSLTCD